MVILKKSKLKKLINNPSLVLSYLQSEMNNFVIKRKKDSLNLAKERDNSLMFLSQHFNADLHTFYSEYKSSEFKKWFDSRRIELSKLIGPNDTSSDFDCVTIYLLVRSLKPDIVVETGVLYGGFSSHILEALDKNGKGELYSIDLANNQNNISPDFFVRDPLKEKFHLVIGDSRAELPKLLKKLQTIDLFNHDSSHTYEHMSWEFNTAFPWLKPGGVISSHDVLDTFFNKNAFTVFCKKNNLCKGIFRNFGIAIKK